MKKIFLFLTIAFISLMIGSCKKGGCTDSAATNYDSKAKKDDGSCIFEKIINPDKININSDNQFYYKLDGEIRHGIEGENKMTGGISKDASGSADTIFDCAWSSYIIQSTKPIKLMIEIQKGTLTFPRFDFEDQDFVDFFAKGKYSVTESGKEGIVIEIEDKSGNKYISNIGNQTGSSFEIIDSKLLPSSFLTYVKIHARFNCVVYNPDNPSDKKTITEGVYVNVFDKSF